MNNDMSKESLGGETLASFLDWAAASYGNRPALMHKPRYATEVWTYESLRDDADRVTQWLQNEGVAPGDRIVIWAPNSPWWVVAFFAVLRAGAIAVPLDIRSSPEFVERVIDQTEPRLAFISDETAARWAYPAPAFKLTELNARLPAPGPVSLPPVAPDDIAEIVFTSGTTAAPKGVILTHRNIRSDVEACYQVFPSGPRLRPLSLLPLSHLFEQTVGLLLPLRGGTYVAFATSHRPAGIIRDMHEYQVTTMLLVPQVLKLFMDGIEREVAERGMQRTWRLLQSVAAHVPRRVRRIIFHRLVLERFGGKLDFFVLGGAPLEPELERKWELLGVAILPGYGSTETAPAITSTSLHDRKPRSVGKAVPGMELKFAPDGEILVKGPNVTPGYWHNPEATEAAFTDGWYRTGDLGELDAEGRLYLRGRKKDMIVLANGQKVYPDDVEESLCRVAGVADAVVLGVPSGDGPRVHAVLLLSDRSADPAAIVREANSRLAPHQRVRGYSVWQESDFPRTHTAKVKKQDVLRVVIAEQEGRPPEAPSPTLQPPAAVTLEQLIAEIAGVPMTQLAPETTLEDAGIDSLSRAELAAAVEMRLGLYLDEGHLDPKATIADLQERLSKQVPADEPIYPGWPLWRVTALVRGLLQLPLFAALRLIGRCRAGGIEHIAGVEGPAILASNHVSNLDSLVILRVLPWSLRQRLAIAAAWETYRRHPWLGRLVGLEFNAFEFAGQAPIRASLLHGSWLVDRGWSLLVYPEGRRSPGTDIGQFKCGVGLLAVDLGMPVVPVRIEGMERVWPIGSRFPRRGDVHVSFGRPLTFPRNTRYQAATATIEAAVRALGDREDGQEKPDGSGMDRQQVPAKSSGPRPRATANPPSRTRLSDRRSSPVPQSRDRSEVP